VKKNFLYLTMGCFVGVPKRQDEIWRCMVSQIEVRNIRDLITHEQDIELLNLNIPDPGPPLERECTPRHLILTPEKVQIYTNSGLFPSDLCGTIEMKNVRNANLVESDKPHQGFGVRILTYTGYSIELFAFMKKNYEDPQLQDPTLAQECEEIFQAKTNMKNRFNLRKEFHYNYADLNGFDKGIVFFYYALGLSIDF